VSRGLLVLRHLRWLRTSSDLPRETPSPNVRNLTDTTENYEYVYDAFGRLRFVKDTGNQSVVAEYTYNGLGYRIGWHSDVDADGTVEANTEHNADDPWFHFVYDTRWRIVAVYRVLHWKDGGGWTFDDDPKERFVYHNAGLAGGGGSSYIDAVILRDRDANTAWEDEADGTLEERVYYCQNWRADVVALFGSNGHMLHQVRYDPYGVPFGISKADINADGVLDSADSSLFVTLYNSGSGTHPFADWNLDGTLNSQDPIAYLNSYNADVALGYGVLSYAYSRAGGANRKGYAGYEIDPVLTGANGRESVYHVRHRVLLSELGRWNRRDPLGYVDGMSLYEYTSGNPSNATDYLGLALEACHRDISGCTNCPDCCDPWELSKEKPRIILDMAETYCHGKCCNCVWVRRLPWTRNCNNPPLDFKGSKECATLADGVGGRIRVTNIPLGFFESCKSVCNKYYLDNNVDDWWPECPECPPPPDDLERYTPALDGPLAAR